MSNCYEVPNCAQCCTVTENFWLYMWGILGTLGALILIFWFNPDLVVKLTGSSGGVYTFVPNPALGGFFIFKNGVDTGMTVGGGTPEELAEFGAAMCRGNIWFWLILGGSFLTGLALSRMISGDPSQFVCCRPGM